MPIRFFALVTALLMARTLQAQTPAGPELLVDTHSGRKAHVSVSADKGGRFVVAWTNDVSQPFARGFGNGFFQALAADGKGGFLAMGGNVITRFDAAGRPLAGPIPIGGAFSGGQLAPTADGGFILARHVSSAAQLILGRRYDSGGNVVGSDFQVNTTTLGFGMYPAITRSRNGEFVVAWQSYDAEDYGIRVQRVSASGERQGGELLVNTTELGYQAFFGQSRDHVAAAARDGSFVVTWSSYDHSRIVSDVMARRYDPAGVPRGDEFRVNTSTTVFAAGSRVAMDDSGNFVIAWTEQAGAIATVRARRFDVDGNARGPEFRVNTSTQRVLFPSVDSDPAGNFVVAWNTDGPGGLGNVLAQRFGGLLPATLAVDAAGNGVLEPGETAVLAPGWRNVNGLPQALAGSLTRLSGPAGGTYTISDAAAAYGTVPNGATGACGADCYAISVSGTRPALHWDAAATERLSPDSQGQVQAWAVHLGDSFSDVPRTSAFYRLVETLLHHGVTGGCGGGAYCPGASTSREQMAVFVLLAREGAGYTPPACTTPRFADVPAASPFCRWVEELARRGVVNGCGGGNYCPAAVVTREEMAVFVLRTLDPALTPPACTTPVFADVPPSSPFCRWIEELARRNVVAGCGGGNYCPSAAVTREQMAAFLGAAFGLTLYGL
jgi:hypothetical protein